MTQPLSLAIIARNVERVEARKLARSSDPETSHAAAANAEAFRARHAALILDALRQWGPMTSKGIAEKTRLDNVQVARRGQEMVEANLVTIGPDTAGGCRIWRRKS